MPKLKKRVDSLEDIPEKYHVLYSEDEDGGFVLDDDIEFDSGKPRTDSARVKEFRDRNVALQKQLREREEALARFKDVDLDLYGKFAASVEKMREEEERELIKAGNVDELIKRRTMAMQESYKREIKAKEEALAARQKEAGTLRGELAALKIDSALDAATAKVGRLRQGARSDATARARQIFTIDETGNVVPNASGEMQYGKEGDPLSMDEFASKLFEEAAHLFEPGEGGGTKGGTKGGSNAPAQRGGKKVIPNDPLLVGQHADAIAKGEVIVEGFEAD